MGTSAEIREEALSAVPLLTTRSSLPGPHVSFALQKYTPLSSVRSSEMMRLAPELEILVLPPSTGSTSTASFRSPLYVSSLYHFIGTAEAKQQICAFCLVFTPMKRGVCLITRAPVEEHLELRLLQDFGPYFTIHKVRLL